MVVNPYELLGELLEVGTEFSYPSARSSDHFLWIPSRWNTLRDELEEMAYGYVPRFLSSLPTKRCSLKEFCDLTNALPDKRVLVYEWEFMQFRLEKSAK